MASSSTLNTLPLIKLPKITFSLANKQSPPRKNKINSKKSQKIVSPSLESTSSSDNPLKPLTSAPILPPLTAFSLPFFFEPHDAQAAGGQLGLLESRQIALIHPIAMSGLFLLTLYAGYHGLQVRRIRIIQEEIEELKKQVKRVAVTPDGKSAHGRGGNHSSNVEAKIQQLTQERKELMEGSYKDKHFAAGSILLGFGVFEAVSGSLSTWFRTGKLLVGPHLFGGTAITVLWAAAASLVPAMQKGNKKARNIHVALNTLNVILFLVQIPTGIEMLFKVVTN